MNETLLNGTRREMYVKRNIQARSCNHCFCGKKSSVYDCTVEDVE